MSSEDRRNEAPGLTEIPEEVEEYLRIVETDTPRQCPEQHALAAYIRKVFREEQLIVEVDRLRKYLSLEKYFPFELYPWEKFLTALWLCTYRAPGLPRWKTLFCLVGRGAGKDGYIAFSSFCLVSPYNPVKSYDVDICANDEEQATRPVKDAVDVLELPRQQKKLNKFFYHTKELIQGRANRGVIKGRTNNPKHRDGMRSGMIVFNEIHAYQNYDNIKVFRTGMGKKAEPREGAFSSNGEISDGPLDDYLERGRRILFGGEEDNGLLPFICCLPNEEMVHDPENWTMANPSLQYSPTLMQEIRDEYAEWKERPEEHGDFLTKRMGLRKGFKEIAVTDYAKVKATNRPLPDLRGWRCTVGIDFAELSDFASVNAHFRRGNERFDICKTWICLQSKTLHRVRAPYREWAKMGLFDGKDPSTPLRSAQDDKGVLRSAQDDRERPPAGGATSSAAAAAPSPQGEGRGHAGGGATSSSGSASTFPVRGEGMTWEDGQRIVELVDDVSIEPRRIAAYIRQLGQMVNIRMLAMDNFRWSTMAEELRKIGFDASDRSRVKLVRPSDIMQVDPIIQECFDRGFFVWGDNPCLRWAVNNTKRLRRGKKDGTDTGNFYFGKIEAKSRKTDPFMALVASMTCEKELGTGQAAQLPPVGAISF